MAEAQDIIDFTLNQQPADAAKAFNDLVNERVTELLDAKREEIAQSMFGGTQASSEDPEDDDDDVEDYDDTDDDDVDLEDDDIDFDDIDIDDLDLDDLEGFDETDD